jgi:fido (protein-threonine AMPylation protein)
MYPPDCPTEWNYEHHQNQPLIAQRIQAFLALLASGKVDTLAVSSDSRSQHQGLFTGLTPPECDYFAGHYRGEDYRCLRSCPVEIQGDPRVGAPPLEVALYMEEIRTQVWQGLLALDADSSLSQKDRLQYMVALACSTFVNFLTVHPYVNGNGHAGRLIVWCILGRYGYLPKNWPVEPRPADPPYTLMIWLYRNGNRQPLESHILQNLSN